MSYLLPVFEDGRDPDAVTYAIFTIYFSPEGASTQMSKLCVSGLTNPLSCGYLNVHPWSSLRFYIN